MKEGAVPFEWRVTYRLSSVNFKSLSQLEVSLIADCHIERSSACAVAVRTEQRASARALLNLMESVQPF
jgi:hypothetical protein